MSKAKSQPVSFKEKLTRLEEISVQLENEDLEIEQMIRIYEEGMKLSNECLTLLREAELKINEIKLNNSKTN